MTVRLIDGSGGLTPNVFEKIRNRVCVGDLVVFFDTEAYGVGRMTTQQDIANLKMLGGGGTIIDKALRLVEEQAPDEPIYCYTDGLFYDGFGYDSKAIRESAHAKAGRFKVVLWDTL